MKRVPFTERAKRITIRKLEAFRDEGYDPNLALEESIQRGWRGVFPQGERRLVDKDGRQYEVTADNFRRYIQ